MRLGNLQVANAFTDGPWRFRRNWLRRNDRDLASLAWRLVNDLQMAGLGSTAILHQLGHSEKRKRASQFDAHEVFNSKVGALTHQIDGAIPLYVSFRRALRGHTTIWYEPLEEGNVGHGGCHEVTGDVYKHITASAQRRLSIERAGAKDGAFLATFGKGAIGRACSESRPTFVSKFIHEHLATGARQEMWAGQAAGSVTCGCGCVLSWAAPDEVSQLQWHMLECALPGENAIRTPWHVAVRSALSKRIKRRDVVDVIMACWATTDGRIHTAAGDQSRGWCAPPMVEGVDSGSCPPDPTAPAPCFGPTSPQTGGDNDTATYSDDEITGLTSDVFSGLIDPVSDPPARRTTAIQTAKGLIA